MPWYRRPGIMAVLALVIIVVAVVAVLWWRHSRRYESTDDAYIDIVSEVVSSQVPGRVTRVLVDDNQDVAAGAVLVELDAADYNARLHQAQAAEAQARAQLAQAEAQRRVRSVELESARAGLGVAEANASNARSDLERLRQVRDANVDAVTPQQIEHATAEAKSADAQLGVAKQAVASATAQIDAADTTVQAAEAGVKAAAAQVEQASLALGYTRITAAVAGRVAHRTVAVGNYVEPGTALLAIVPREVYVTANFKETQLARMRRAQPVTIKVDAYPDLKLTGHVDSVQPATGQQFSELPAQNATGNWVKVVQRVPVKIRLDALPDDAERRLGPGMSVTAKVTVQ